MKALLLSMTMLFTTIGCDTLLVDTYFYNEGCVAVSNKLDSGFTVIARVGDGGRDILHPLEEVRYSVTTRPEPNLVVGVPVSITVVDRFERIVLSDRREVPIRTSSYSCSAVPVVWRFNNFTNREEIIVKWNG